MSHGDVATLGPPGRAGYRPAAWPDSPNSLSQISGTVHSTDEVRTLRAISSRATITPTRFSNFYNFGSLKAKPHDLLARYFDAFVYLANWRYRELAFRFPKAAFDAKTAKLYRLPNGLTVRTQGTYNILIVSAESPDDETEFEDDEGRGWLSALAGLRADVAAGDHRLLYLAWLMGVQAGDTDDDAVEPPCPPGLDELSGTLEAFIDFVWLFKPDDGHEVVVGTPGSGAPASRLLTRRARKSAIGSMSSPTLARSSAAM